MKLAPFSNAPAKSASVYGGFGRNQKVDRSPDRSFGLIFGTAFLLIGLAPLRHQQSARLWALATAVVMLTVSLVLPRALHPANWLWTQLGLVLHRMVSPIAMGVLFFLVATPLGALMRWWGKDALNLRFDPAAESYWCLRSPPGPAPNTMSNQF